MEKKRNKKKLVCILMAVIFALIIACFASIFIAHSIVFSRCDYKKYDSEHYLLYDKDIDKNKYPREQIYVQSGENKISAFEYGKGNDKGLIVVAPGHRDANDIKLYEIRYFVDAGYSVICLDYTGCYTSEGKNMRNYTQSVYDLDALLDYIEDAKEYKNVPVHLFGHSMGGYAVCAVLNMEHSVKSVVSASGFDNPEEQWQYSIKRFTSVAYPLVKPLNSLFINLEYGKDKNLSAVKGINSVSVPVLVISAEDDVFYGGKSPIYRKQKEITNPNCSFMLMDKKNHNGHYDYFLTDAALKYSEGKPKTPIDKELYNEHDEKIMEMIVGFFER